MLGEPDLVVEMPAAYHVPADGPDIYRNIAIPLGLTEDKWITAIDMQPSARSVVHHVLYFADPERQSARAAAAKAPNRASAACARAARPFRWAAGLSARSRISIPEGLAMRVAEGFRSRDSVSFPSDRQAGSGEVRGRAVFREESRQSARCSIQLPPVYSLFSGLDIPAGDKDFVIRDSYTLPVAIDAVGVGAHAHYLGKKLKMTATLPDGEVKTLLCISDWDFAWQDRYFFKVSVPLPKGTRLDAEIHWDNSAANPRNPSNPPDRASHGASSRRMRWAASR